MSKLTALQVKKLSIAEGYKDYADGDGLYLRVEPSGKRWYFRYTKIGSKSRTVCTLGPYHEKTNGLAAAREAAAECKRILRGGVDPKDYREATLRALHDESLQRKKEASARELTFEKVAYEWFHQKKLEWRNVKHRSQNINTLITYVFPHMGNVPIGEIDQAHVRKCLDPIWRTKTETATRVRQRIDAVMSFATANGYFSGQNPAEWKGFLSAVYPSPEKLKKNAALAKGSDGHFAAMAYGDLPEFYQRLVETSGFGAAGLRFLILTASRTKPVRFMTWDQLDLSKKIWSVPAEYMKNARQFRVALSDEAVALVDSLPRVSKFVFPSSKPDKPLSDGGMSSVLRRLNVDVTVHGFRSSFRDYIAEETGFSYRVAEYALAHQLNDETEKAYARGDLLQKRFELMNHWASYMLGEPKVK